MRREKAQRIVQEHLDEITQGNAVILEDETEEVFCGWVFFYQSKMYLKTGNFRHALAGNAPILFDRRDISMHCTGTANPTNYYIQNYRNTGDTHVEND